MEKSRRKTALLAVAVAGGLTVFLAFLLIPRTLIFAATEVATDIQGSGVMSAVAESSTLSTESLPIVIARVIRVFLGVLGIILVMIIIYCGWLYMTAHGEAEKLLKARKIFRSTAIGLLIIFSSFAITTFVLNKLLEMAGLGGGVSTTSVNYSEPLSASLGSGIIETHYPARNAIDIPRNARIMITFKDEIDMESIISEYGAAVDSGNTVFYLNSNKVLIYPTNDLTEDKTAAEVALSSEQVIVTFDNIDYNEDGTIDPESYERAKTEGSLTFVFDPVEPLGNDDLDTNYTVSLLPTIMKADGSGAFSGVYEDGYEWSFTVSTEFDLTPPHVVSVIPAASGTKEYARNSVIQINFNEAMDPVAGTGTYHLDDPDDDSDIVRTFTHIKTQNESEIVEGTYSISNSYKTIEFVSEDACGEDPCGNTIYCLPGSVTLEVTVLAATLSDDPPQASVSGGLFDGLIDAAGNSLDGSGPTGVYDGEAAGPPDDNYSWAFLTSAEVEDTPPQIDDIYPSPSENEEIEVNQEIEITFSATMWSSTLNSNNVQLVPNHEQGLWYLTENETETDGASSWTKASTNHGVLWATDYDEGGNQILYYYYPVITQGVRGSNQICLYPAVGPGKTDATCASESAPNCCDGESASDFCKTLGTGTDDSIIILGQ